MTLRLHRKNIGLLLAAILVTIVTRAALATGKEAHLAIQKEAWYSIKWNDQLVGFSRYSIERSVALGGDAFYVVNSDSRLRLGIGEGSDIVFKAKTLLNHENLQPSFFFCRQTQGKTSLEVECLFTGNVVAQKNRMGRDETTTTVNVNSSPFLVFNNMWGRLDTFAEHYSVLLAAWQAGGEKPLPVYEPVLRGSASIHIQEDHKGNVNVGGRDVAARYYVISDTRKQPLVGVWVAADKSEQIVKLDDLRGGFSFELSNPTVEAALKSSPGVDPWIGRTQFSNVYFPNADDLRSFKATLDVHLRGAPRLDRNILGFSQKFEGTASDGQVQGAVTVTSAKVEVAHSDLYPRKKPYGGELAPFLAAEPGIESSDDETKSKAQEVAWRSRTSWEAARKINSWLHEKVATGYSLPSARYVLEHAQGNSESKALLEVAMLRASGIPSRKVVGVLFAGGNFIPHYWVEAYIGTDGWVALDPSTGEEGTLGATHVALADQGDLTSLDVKVLDYAPRPAPRVAFFNRELTWPVGQQRVYAVLHGGKQIGKETARVKSLVSQDGKDAYQMEFDVDVKLEGQHFAYHADLLTDTTALPLLYQVRQGEKKAPIALTFKDGMVCENVKTGDKEQMQQTPVSSGVYLADHRFMSMWAMLLGQIPNPQVGQKLTIYTYQPETHTTEDIALQIREEEKIGVSGEERDTYRCESADGVSFYIDKQSGQIVRIEQPRQDLVLQLMESSMKI